MYPTASERRRDLTPVQLERLRSALGTDLSSVTASPLVGGIDTATYLLVARHTNGEVRELVLRSYRGWETVRAAERIQREREVLDAIAPYFPLAPRALFSDPSGERTGDPFIVLSRLPGSPAPPPKNSDPATRSRWIEDFTKPLCEIHSIEPDKLPAGFRRDESPASLLDRVEREVTGDELPVPVAAALHRALPAEIAAPVLLHHDYWYGNTLWHDGRLTGVVDWSSARLGDPRKDLALARADLAVTLDLQATNEMVADYERIRGPLGTLLFWDLIWAVIAYRSMDQWLIGYAELGLADLGLVEARSRVVAFAEHALRQHPNSEP
jgi:aminoglycoside phosphotransferase (APT) family kinase protein